ncbi:MAG TPA: DUF4276 family protein [bacterium]|nr:DUF4276 family protein [bacterium]
MNPIHIVAIVEGHGEETALPVLIRKIARENNIYNQLVIKPVFRIPATRLKKEGELERQVELAARSLPSENGAILILVDCDGENDCPAQEGPALLARAQAARKDKLISVVLAKKEFESWFIAAASSLRGVNRLSQTMPEPDDPESIRGAKEWLSGFMPQAFPYAATIDQERLTIHFDMTLARRADSFDKCYREIVKMLRYLAG